jgi:hypothetical protein
MPYSELDITEGLTKEEKITIFDPTCIRQKSNMSQNSKKYIFDSGSFEPELLLKDMKYYSPKLEKLLDKINELDKKDMEKYGKKFKHFIFSDLKSSAYGPKLISSGFIAKGYHLGYSATELLDKDKKHNGWKDIHLLSETQLKKTAESNFYLLSSVAVYDKPISVKMKREILQNFNQRPENVNGELARIIIMDSGFKEGIDLFDIKYIHIFEPSVNDADQKQVIGRGTRTCGQKGLDFHPNRGWSLHVFIYDLEFPTKYTSKFLDSDTSFELYMKSIHLDARIMNFTSELEEASIYGSVDHDLNKNIHQFTRDTDDDTIYGGDDVNKRLKPSAKFEEMRNTINNRYREFTWEPAKFENTCGTNIKGGVGKPIEYNPTQNFIRHYFSPENSMKGMLLYHSTGTGKTCSAIAAASRNFEPLDYTILWVTRTTLKNDIWKNMFSQICNENLLNKANTIPDDPKKQMSLLSKSWRIRPLSYKQFSNLVSQENIYYKRLVKENGSEDPLRKTLLIIDEAHKLYGGGDLSSIERPDMVALHKALMHSYAVSGKDSVRLLLMTATPITENPMELIQLINLCKPLEEQMPATFDSFKNNYLDTHGRFTNKGYSQYLDEISGHISYLNREKDARQFAQPIIKRVLVKITDENIIEKFDKGIIKNDLDETILDLKTKTTETMKELEGDLNEIDAKRFSFLKTKCKTTSLRESTCNKIIRKNIKELVDEIKTYKQTIKNKIKEIKEKMKSASLYKENEMKKIIQNINNDPSMYEKYKKSAFFIIKSECGRTVKTNQEVLDELEEHPEIKKYNQNIQEHEKYIDQLRESLKVDKDAFKLKMRKMNELLKGDLSEIEKYTLKMIIKENNLVYNKTKKNTTEKIQKEIEKNKKNIQMLEREKRKKYQKVQKSLKQMVVKGRKEKKMKKKEIKKLRKTLKIQGKLENDITNIVVKDLMKKQEDILERDLENAEKKELYKEETMREKERKKLEKEAEKERKEAEKERKKTEKERKKLEKEEKRKTKKNQNK